MFEICEAFLAKDYKFLKKTSSDVPEEVFRHDVQQTYNKLKEVLEE